MKDIKGYEGLYAVTESGEVWSYKRRKFLKPRNCGSGYLFVTLCKDGEHKHRMVHRIVAEAFLPNPDELPQVNHKDEVKSNNWVWNLEWCDRKYNMNYGTGHERSAKSRTNHPKLSHKIRCVETGEKFESIHDCARKLGCSSGNLSKHLKGKRDHVNGYTFEYVDSVAEKECNTDITAVREMLRNSCRYYLNKDILNVVGSSNCGRVYNYNDSAYNLHNCEDVCDLYEALFGIRPIAVKCADGKYVIYADHYGYEVRQNTISLCEQIIKEL